MTIIKGNIGNALHSVAPDHIVATADEIFDEALGQYQNEINQSAGAFDISEYNKSGDTPATYATLALALAGVPSAQQKGGMSVRYIQNIPAIYYVTRTSNVSEQPAGTALSGESAITTGEYYASQLSDFSSLPANVNTAVKYYYEVSSQNWTTWTVVKQTDDSTQYRQYMLTATSWSLNTRYWQGISEIKEKINELNQQINGTKIEQDFSVATGVDYSSAVLFLNVNIPSGSTYDFLVADKSSVSTGKYALNIWYADGSYSNPVNPYINNNYRSTAAKTITKIGAYISSGKITTAGVLSLSCSIVGADEGLSAKIAENAEGISSLAVDITAINEKDNWTRSTAIDVVTGTIYGFDSIKLDVDIQEGETFTSVLKDISSESSGQFAFRMYYSDGTNANASTNPSLNSTFTLTAAKHIIKIACYLSNNKILKAGKLFFGTTYSDATILRQKIYTVGTNGDYQTFVGMLEALENDTSDKVVYVEGGEYDIFEEMGGADYIATITDPSSLNWADVCPIVPPNTTIIGRGNVLLKWLPSATVIGSEAMAFLFSPLNLRGNCKIVNISIDCMNCRYGIHDETGSTFTNTVHEFINVKVLHREETYGKKYAYGAGHCANSVRIYKDCEFVAYYGNVWSTHDWADAAGKGSTFTFDNCLIYDARSNEHTPAIFTSSDRNGRIDKVRFNNCYIPNKIAIYSGGSSGTYNQAYDITLLGCNTVDVTRSSNMENVIEVKQYLSR